MNPPHDATEPASPAQPDLIGGEVAPDPMGLIGGDLSDVSEAKWAPTLASMVQVLEAHHRRQGRPDTEAFDLACQAVLVLAEYFGARVWYLPRGDRLRKALRDARIHWQWQRKVPIEEIGAEHRISVIHVYRIIDQQRRLHLGKIQPGLPFQQEGV
jgi:Mor family transcriptional regulator